MKVNQIQETSTIKELLESFVRNNQPYALVMRNGSVVGLVTQGDVVRLMLKKISINTKVKEVMTINFNSLSSVDSHERMKEHKLKQMPYIPILKNGTLVGVSSVYMEEILKIE